MFAGGEAMHRVAPASSSIEEIMVMRHMLTTLVMAGGLSLGLSASALATVSHGGAGPTMSGGASTRASAGMAAGSHVTPQVPVERSVAPTPEPFGGGTSGTSIYDEPPAASLSCAELGGRAVAGPDGYVCR